MKKIVLILFSCLAFLSGFSQFSVNAPSVPALTNQDGIDYIIIINGINASTDLSYVFPYNTINWYKFSDPNNSISNVDYISPEDATGYILDVDGDIKTIWVFDYQQYLPQLTDFEPDLDESGCEETVFRLNQGAVPEMVYYPLGSSSPRYLKREFTLTYNTKEYVDKAWIVIDTIVNITFPISAIKTPPSLDPDVDFVLAGDQYAEALGLQPATIHSSDIPITAVRTRLTSLVSIRDALNEVDRPKENEPTPPISGSAPIEILFESRPSDENAMFDWKIYKGNELIITRTDKDHRYTFSSPGEYKVVLDANNGYCTTSDSVQVSVSLSLLEVPNVFTPNGDGINDEFRVTYRSLESFHCWIYNNWGKKVYEWTDPAKGWDGRINGKKAPSGTYFYVIKAKGTDGKNHNKKGDVSIIR